MFAKPKHVIVREPGPGTFVRSRETDRAYEGGLIRQKATMGRARAQGKVGVLAVPSQVATALSLAEGVIALHRTRRVRYRRQTRRGDTAYYHLKDRQT